MGPRLSAKRSRAWKPIISLDFQPGGTLPGNQKSFRPELFALCARQMRSVLFVFGADVLEHIGVRKKLLDEIDRDRPGESFRVGNRDGNVQMAEIASMEPLLDAHVFAVPMAAGVQPTEI